MKGVMAKSATDNTPPIAPRYARFRLRVRRSRIHRWGVYAGEAIPPGRKVLEYTGEKLNRQEKKRREDSKYLFELNAYWALDGGVGGSGAEVVNHSCNPNLATPHLKGHILYFSRRRPAEGEGVTGGLH